MKFNINKYRTYKVLIGVKTQLILIGVKIEQLFWNIQSLNHESLNLILFLKSYNQNYNIKIIVVEYNNT